MDERKAKRTADAVEGRVVEEQVIPVVEERLDVTRKARQGRTVTVSTRVVTEQVEVAEPVTREQVEVERVAVDRVIDAVPAIREEGDVTVIPVVEERLVVRTELVLKEEIRLRRTRSTTTETHTVDVRRTEVDISEN